MINSGDGEQGVAECPYEFYRNWVHNSEAAREAAERISRKSVGTSECPIPGVPKGEAAAAAKP